MTGPVLLALDGSRFAERALPLALRMAQGCDTGLDLVTISEPIPTLDYTDWNHAAESWSADYIQEVGESCSRDASVTVTTFSAAGDPLHEILARAKDVGASMIVAATHGRGPLSRAWLGSVADSLLRESPVPLLLVRPSESDEKDVDPTVSRIAVALDGSDVSHAVLPHAARLARGLDAGLRLVRVVLYPGEVGSPYLPQTVTLNQTVLEKTREAASVALEAEATGLRSEGLDVQVHVVDDVQAARGIVAATSEFGAEIILMGTHGRGGLRRAVLGSVADKVVRSSPVPVLVVPSRDRDSE